MTAASPLGVRDSRTRDLAIAVLVSALPHLVFTPLPFMLRALGAWLHRADAAWDYEDDRVVVPISLFEAPAPPPSVTVEPERVPLQAEPVGQARDRDALRPDAGAHVVSSDAGAHPALADAGAGRSRDGGPRRDANGPGGASDRRVRDGGPDVDGGGPRVRDTLSLGHGLQRAVEGTPNVRLILWFSTMREHALGPLVGGLLACSPQWQDFIADRVDLLKDLDGLMLYGPQLRDSSKISVVAKHHLQPSRVDAIFGALAATGGRSAAALAAEPGTTAVRFRADRAERVALTHPNALLIVTPPEKVELFLHAPPMSFPEPRGLALSLTLATPWRPARAIGLHLPETLSELRAEVVAVENGAIEVRVELDDVDAAAASSHAASVSEEVRAMSGLFFSDFRLAAEDHRLAGSTRLSRIAGALLLGLVRGMVCPAGGPDGGGRGP